MKALFIHDIRDLRLEECPTNQNPGVGQVKVSLSRGGICGSDLHYYLHGGVGLAKLREPMILGHEVSGTISEIGPDVAGLETGEFVAISPSLHCNSCTSCLKGQQNHCQNMRFFGSAIRMPHIQGAFRQEIIVEASQCVPAKGLSLGKAALAEPLAVALHGVRQAGDLVGKRVLVTGCGPIGIMAILASRAAGASEIVASDINDRTLAYAKKAGATHTFNPIADQDKSELSGFDVAFECSGANVALNSIISAMLPRGIIIQLGLMTEAELPMMQLTARELVLKGSFRFHEEFRTAVQLMQSGQIDPEFMVTHVYPLSDFETAFDQAINNPDSLKVQLELSAD